MANTKSAEKRARQAVESRAQNVAQRSKARSAVRKVVEAINAGNKAEAAAALKAAAAGDRLDGPQGHHSSQQGRPPQEPPVAAQIKAMPAK